jgi:hypothetical protein
VSRETFGDFAARYYATRFERCPAFEPWRSAWCRIETWHAAAILTPRMSAACALADARYSIELSTRHARCSGAPHGVLS